MKKLLLLMITCVHTAFSQDVSLIEKELLRLIQEERTKAGLNEVIHLDILDRTAEIQSTYLATLSNIGDVTHSHPNKSLEEPDQRYLSLKRGDISTSIFENITVFTYRPSEGELLTALRAHNNFMKSKGHSLIVMNDLTCVFSENKPEYNYGHSIIFDKKNNWIIVVQIFQGRYERC
jgi:uncharacterized protein YkwD